MNPMNYLEHIGKLTFEYYNAEYERVKTRDARSKARADHPCENETIGETGDPQPYPCHLDVRLSPDNWCDNCNFVQPYWLEYRKAAEKTRKAKYRLSRKIKSLINKGYQY
jgi:hypothetical protein